LLPDELCRLPAVGCRLYVCALGPEEEREYLADVLGVFNDEDAKTPLRLMDSCGRLFSNRDASSLSVRIAILLERWMRSARVS